MFKNYNEQNGLPSSETYYVFEDHEGFIWFATDNGLISSDFYSFVSFTTSPGLVDNDVHQLLLVSNAPGSRVRKSL